MLNKLSIVNNKNMTLIIIICFELQSQFVAFEILVSRFSDKEGDKEKTSDLTRVLIFIDRETYKYTQKIVSSTPKI